MMPRIHTLRQGWGSFLRLFYPEVCGYCNDAPATVEQAYLCEACRNDHHGLRYIADPFCKHCGTPFHGDVTSEFECSNCMFQPLHFDKARSGLHYTGLAQFAVTSYKYKRAFWFETLFREVVRNSFHEQFNDAGIDMIVPVPLHWFKKRTRSFNQSERLAGLISTETGIPVKTNILRRNVPTPTQTRLSRTERAENVKRAFSFRPRSKLNGETALLVDDVMTTGATASSCARILKQNGAGEVFVWTVARGTLQ